LSGQDKGKVKIRHLRKKGKGGRKNRLMVSFWSVGPPKLALSQLSRDHEEENNLSSDGY